MKRPATVAINVQATLRSKLRKREDKATVTLYCREPSYLLETKVKHDIVVEMDADVRGFLSSSSKLPTEYAKALWNKVFRCSRVYEEYLLKRIFVEGWSESIRHSMCVYWGSRNIDTVYDSAQFATLPMELTVVQAIPMCPDITKRRKSDAEIMGTETRMLMISRRKRSGRWNRPARVLHPHHHHPQLCRYCINAPIAATSVTSILASELSDINRCCAIFSQPSIPQPVHIAMTHF